MSIAAVKNAIKTKLDTLVTSEVLKAATITDIKTNPLNVNTSKYPHAFLMPPAVESQILDNRNITRTYTFGVMVLIRAEDIASTTEVEELIEDILNVFDNDPTLNNTALGGITPLSSSPEPFQHNGRDMIMVDIEIKATTVVQLTFA